MTAAGVHAPLAEGHRAIAVLVALFTASVFLSTAATNILAAVMCAVALVQWVRYRPWWLLRQPIALACMAFFGWLLLRETLDGEVGREALKSVSQFRPLLFLVLWAPLFMAVRHRRAAVGATLASLVVFFAVAVLAFLVRGHPFYTTQPYDLWSGPLGQPVGRLFYDRAPDLAGPALLVALFGSVQLALDERRWRWLLLFAAGATFVLFVVTGRKTSQLVFLACGAFLLVLQLRPASVRARLGWTLAALGLAVTLAASPVVRSGAQRVWSESLHTMSTPVEQRAQAATSTGLRIRFWEVGAQVVRSSPWIGTSESAYRERFLVEAEKLGGIHERHANPHNEYLHVTGALGLLGLVMYVGIHAAVAAQAAKFPSSTQRKILGYYLLAALSTALANSLVIDMIPGHFHALALLVLGWFAWDRTTEGEPA